MKTQIMMNNKTVLFLSLIITALITHQELGIAQTRQPTNAEINKLRQQLQQTIRSIRNDRTTASYVEDRRTQVEKNTRESFVRAWSKVEPKLAPFMGAWYGYESGRYIYPSNAKGRVCIVVKQEGTGTLNTGVLFNGVIRTNSGELLFKEGNFLGAALLEKNRFTRNYDLPFHHARPLESLTKLLDSLYDASPSQKNKIAQQFKAAGCTNSLPGEKSKTKVSQSIQNLADGNYFYGEVPLSNQSSKHYLGFQKKGVNILGFSYIHPGDYDCFKGIAQNNTITNLIFTQQEGEKIKVERGAKPFDMTSYHRLQYKSSFSKNLQQCIADFQKIKGGW